LVHLWIPIISQYWGQLDPGGGYFCWRCHCLATFQVLWKNIQPRVFLSFIFLFVYMATQSFLCTKSLWPTFSQSVDSQDSQWIHIVAEMATKPFFVQTAII
jgi:hypothetical protein